MQKAKRGDWKAKPMPPESQLLTMEATFTAEEFDTLTSGFIPEDMDDRWFFFYEAPLLYLHRSWTGTCIFVVRFETLDEGVRIAEARVNRNLEQYGATDEASDVDLLRQLLKRFAAPEFLLGRQKLAFRKHSGRVQAIVAVAEKMLSGELGVVEGSRQIVALESHTKFYAEEKFQVFRAIDSEADVLPTGPSRKYWNPEVLRRKDLELAEYEARMRDAALQACQELVDRYKTQE